MKATLLSILMITGFASSAVAENAAHRSRLECLDGFAARTLGYSYCYWRVAQDCAERQGDQPVFVDEACFEEELEIWNNILDVRFARLDALWPESPTEEQQAALEDTRRRVEQLPEELERKCSSFMTGEIDQTTPTGQFSFEICRLEGMLSEVSLIHILTTAYEESALSAGEVEN